LTTLTIIDGMEGMNKNPVNPVILAKRAPPLTAKFKIKVRVKKILEGGTCPLGLKPGDEFVFEHLPPQDFCHWAFHVILPFATALRFGGNIPWEKEEGKATLCCPDAQNPVVFELERIRLK